uniref:Coiled-coil domain containing 117 n=1 Tax=Leptobrachium leishanense TaxID=445787 RepID=A0A8C5Q3T3_9ANUR
MAAIDRPFNAVPLFGMEYAQSPDSCFQRSHQPDSSVLASVPDVNQTNGNPMAHTLNLNNPYFTTYSQCASSVTPGGSYPNVGCAPLFQNVREGPVFSPLTTMGCTAPMRKKHKRHEDAYEYPLKKRRLSETSVVTLTPNNEAMEETPVESLCDAACRRLQDIDNRLSLDEDIEAENSTPARNLPTLIMSELLQESLKKGFEESFTKKMVESMSRPSMELVLWKPQPEFLIDKLQAVSRCQKNKTDVCKSGVRSESAFPNKSQAASEDKSCTSSPSRDIDTMWDRDEEEMEH